MNYNEGKLLLEQKVNDFQKNEKMYLDRSFQETEIRNRFVDPFFQALGWEFDQTSMKRYLWDVQREYSQKDNASTKKPDYAFRVNGKLRFFVEAKAPWVPLTDNAPVFQAKRYAFSTNGRAPIVIITDFQEFRVFNSLERPVFNNPLQGLLKEFDINYKEYLDRWDLVYGAFSKEAVESGSLDILRGKICRTTRTLDAEFLNDIVAWRETLARNIAVRNKNLTVNQINEAVQRILDRLIFIRNLEDRDIQPENRLLNIAQMKESVYGSLIPVFNELDKEYNGILFKKHFSEELAVDDKIIKDIIKSMCYPESPFQFDVIEPEILGRIYEKFLGSKIRLTENHLAKVEEKPEVRHAGGVYYTPQFIVDYIVRNTVGKKIDGLSPEEIKNIKILDPACGSGSFLIGAFDCLIKYHEKYYSEHKSSKKYKDDFFQTRDDEFRLTLAKKGEILINNIFGVDIDREAAEVAMMSLYLKLLEGGFYEGQSLLFMKGHVLPDLTNNIKCGNSLINRDDLYSSDMFGKDRISPFDWKDEKSGFGAIFNAPDKGGFDCVIGNPPYIRIQELNLWYPDEAALYKKIFLTSSKGNFDIYVLFIEKGLSLLNEDGIFGMILPNKFFNSSSGEKLRKILSNNKNVAEVVHFGDLQIFEGPTTYTCLLFLTKAASEEIVFSKVVSLGKWISNKEAERGIIQAENLTANEWVFIVGGNVNIFNKLENFQPKLGDVANLFVGLQTDCDDIFILEEIEQVNDRVRCFSKFTNQEHWFENDHLKYLIKGSVNIKPYLLVDLSKRLIFPYRTINNKSIIIDQPTYKKNYPLTWKYLEINKKKLSSRNKGKIGDSWYGYVYKKNHTKFDQAKLLVPSISSRASFAYDEDGNFYFVGSGGGGGGGYGITLKEKSNLSYEYLLGLLNSKLLDTYLQSYSSPFRGGYYAYNRQYIEKLPIYIPDESEKEKFEMCKKIEELVKQMLVLRKDENKQADADFLEKKIDEMVEKIYFG